MHVKLIEFDSLDLRRATSDVNYVRQGAVHQAIVNNELVHVLGCNHEWTVIEKRFNCIAE